MTKKKLEMNKNEGEQSPKNKNRKSGNKSPKKEQVKIKHQKQNSQNVSRETY